MTIVRNNAEGQTSGTNVTAANSGGGSGTALSTVSPSNTSGIIFSSAAAAYGNNGYRLTAVGTAAVLVDLDDTTNSSSSNTRAQVYFTLPAIVSQVSYPFGIRNTGANIGAVDIDATGHIRVNLAVPSVVAGTFSTGTLSASTLYRAEILGTGFGTASTTITVNVYLGLTNTLVATCTVSGTTSTVFNRIRPGKVATGNATGVDIDEIAIEMGGTTEIGPPPAVTADATLAVTFSTTTAADRTAFVDATLPVTVTLSTAATRTAPADATLASTVTITAAAAAVRPAAATLSVTVTAAAAATRTAAVAATLASTVTITAGAFAVRPVDATLATTATITAAATVGAAPVTATLATTFTATAAADRTAVAAATLAVTATITAAALLTRVVGSSLALTATVLAAAAKTAAAAATLPLTFTSTATGSTVGVVPPGGTMRVSGRATPGMAVGGRTLAGMALSARALPTMKGG